MTDGGAQTGTASGEAVVVAALRRWPFWVGLLLGLTCLWLAFRDVSLPDVAEVLSAADGLFLFLTLLVQGANILSKVLRWRALLGDSGRQLRLTSLLTALLAGQMVNLMLPMRLGEVARAYLVGQSQAVGKVFALGTVAVEKAIDSVVLLILALLTVAAVGLPDWLTRPAAATGAIVVAILLVAVGAFRWSGYRGLPSLIARGIAWVAKRLAFDPERLAGVLAEARGGLVTMGQRKVALWTSLWSLGVWITALLTNYFLFLALRLDVPFQASLLLLVVLYVGVSVPSSPARIGVFQYLVILGLSLFSVPKSLALTYSLALYVIVFGPMIVLGIGLLWLEGWRRRL
jgi:uncharacterized protein (TIRG00374 family)